MNMTSSKSNRWRKRWLRGDYNRNQENKKKNKNLNDYNKDKESKCQK
jgi:hypothetical protein